MPSHGGRRFERPRTMGVAAGCLGVDGFKVVRSSNQGLFAVRHCASGESPADVFCILGLSVELSRDVAF